MYLNNGKPWQGGGMKKTLIIFCVLFIATPTLSFDFFGEEEINKSKLQERNGKKYKINQDEPYSGKVVDYYKNGQKKEEMTFKNGIYEGSVIQWYENGQKSVDINFKNGKQDGPAIYWHKNGQKATEGYFKGGKRDGVYVEWHENEKKNLEMSFKDGELESMIFYNSDGTIKKRASPKK